MPRFSEAFIEQIQQATSIVELVGQYVSLKKRGAEFVGLCPFHDDRNPSMYVSPGKQIFKCFACGAGGGVFQFVMMYDKLSFPEAVEALAQRAGIALPAEKVQRGPAGLSRAELAKATGFAQQWFAAQLQNAAGREALEYARGRGISDEAIREFGLGYAPDAWEGLARAAATKGFAPQQLEAAGLVAPRKTGGHYDRFRHRLMFPIRDVTGRVIAFGGRALSPEERAKYLNSPETALFDKSSNLYGLDLARKEIGSSDRAVVVEGYLDALIPYQHGVCNVVATLGTALTDRHVRLLARYAKEVVLVFDADVAGATAVERALEIFLAQQIHVRVATIPAGKDPCDFVLSDGPEAFARLIDDAPDALQYTWDKRFGEYQGYEGNPAAQREVLERFLTMIARSSAYGSIDEIRRGQLAQHIAHMLNVPLGKLQEQMHRLGRRARAAAAGVSRTESFAPRTETLAERQVLEVLLDDGELFDAAAEKIDPHEFTDPTYRRLAEIVWKYGQDGNLSIESILNDPAVAEGAPLLTDLAAAGARRGNHAATLAGAVESMLYRRRKQETRQLVSGPLDDDALRELQLRLRQPDPRNRPRIR